MAGMFCHHGRARISVASLLVFDLSFAETIRRFGGAGRKAFHQRSNEVQAGVGLWSREISYRSCVVVLSFLAADVLHGRAPLYAPSARHRADDCLQYFGGWCAAGRRGFE